MGLRGSDSVELTAWFKDLTYNEVHAFVVGFAPMFFGVVAFILGYEKLAGFAFGVVGLLFAVAYKERTAPHPTLKILPNNVWYFGGGVVLAAHAAVVMALTAVAVAP